MEILNTLVSWIIKKRIHQIDFFLKYPSEVQQEWLLKLLDTASDTEFGRKYDFQNIHNHEEYISKVPIQDYDSLKPYILRTKQGEQNLIWPTEIKWFAKSSGTTSDKSKFIPVSKEALEDCHYKGGKDLLAIYYHNRPDARLFTGKGLVIGGSSEINQYGKNSYFGDLSSIIIRNLPNWVEYIRIPSVDIALNPKWEEKLEQMAAIAPNENVTNISGVPTWNLILIKRILEITNKQNMLEVWPNFELYAHGGVSFTPYKEQFKALFPSDKVVFLENYNASEGYFGIQDGLHRDDMLLMLDYGIYYEFLPMEELGKEYPKTLQLHEVSIDVNYALVISTNGGLWRYMLGDTIKFTELNPYRIKVSGRTKYYINCFGEELMADNAEHALDMACKKTGSIVSEYTAGPVFMNDEGKGGHEWLIEFEKAPENLDFFTETLDTALKSVNSDYEAKRYKNIALQMPIVRALPKGTFYKWMEGRGKIGGQNKIPRLANNRDYLDSVLKLI
jgi:hypothetical protein